MHDIKIENENDEDDDNNVLLLLCVHHACTEQIAATPI